MPGVSQVAKLHLRRVGDYSPLKVFVEGLGLSAEIYPLKTMEYLIEGRKDTLFGDWELCVYTPRCPTPGSALNGFLLLYGDLTNGYYPFKDNYKVSVWTYLSKEKRTLSCDIVCDGYKKPWYEDLSSKGRSLYKESKKYYKSPGDVLDAYLARALPEPFAEYVYRRGTFGEI